jgi:hypothetical protein
MNRSARLHLGRTLHKAMHAWSIIAQARWMLAHCPSRPAGTDHAAPLHDDDLRFIDQLLSSASDELAHLVEHVSKMTEYAGPASMGRDDA